MSVVVTKEPDDFGGLPRELCCLCAAPTIYWFGTGPKNVALCQPCASNADESGLPTKAEWIRNYGRRRERQRNK